jgi:hypothetical protein
MPEPWWHYLIAPDALRAAAILAAAFAAAWAWKRWKRGPWRLRIDRRIRCVEGGFHAYRVSGPWPFHACIGPLSIDVLRRS